MSKTTDIELSWAAGMFEGEGSVRISRSTQTRRSELRCELSNTDEDIITIFRGRWGGSVNPVYGQEMNRKPQLRWVASGSMAFHFLSDVLPYLRTKRVKQKAKIGMAFYKNPNNPKYCEELTRLNKKGMPIEIPTAMKGRVK